MRRFRIEIIVAAGGNKIVGHDYVSLLGWCFAKAKDCADTMVLGKPSASR
ncbi:MAG: hypothetical protein K2O38_03435 [Muribaculaceae bacterium]|nr:hypothetical protein [Muribaculaceae bacterium]